MASLHHLGSIAEPRRGTGGRAMLDQQDGAWVRRCAHLGAHILSRVPSLPIFSPLLQATYEHRDGGGMPRGLAGEAIPLGARILRSGQRTKIPYSRLDLSASFLYHGE